MKFNIRLLEQRIVFDASFSLIHDDFSFTELNMPPQNPPPNIVTPINVDNFIFLTFNAKKTILRSENIFFLGLGFTSFVAMPLLDSYLFSFYEDSEKFTPEEMIPKKTVWVTDSNVQKRAQEKDIIGFNSLVVCFEKTTL